MRRIRGCTTIYEGRESMIHVFDDYYIDADEYQYILKQDMHRKDKKNNDVYKAISYHKTIFNALWSLRDKTHREITSGNDIELAKALRMISDADSEMTDIMKKAIPESEW